MSLRRDALPRVKIPTLGRRAAFVGTAELNPLRERQLGRKVDRVRLPAHVALPGIAPALPTAAGVFLAAKSATDFGAARSRVHISDSAIAPDHTDKFFRLANAIGENRTR